MDLPTTIVSLKVVGTGSNGSEKSLIMSSPHTAYVEEISDFDSVDCIYYSLT